MSDFVSPDTIREQLGRTKEQGHFEIEDAEADRIAAVIRDGIIVCGGDPSDRQLLYGMLIATWLSLRVALQMPLFSLVMSLWYQGEVLRRMVDGELPMLTIEDMLGLPDLKLS